MPHKRAKQSVRVEERKKRGYNLVPTSSSIRDDTPRSASRILNAITSQAKFRERGGRSGEDTGEYRPKKKKGTTGGKEAESSKESASTVAKDVMKPSIKGKEKAQPDIPAILPHEKLSDYNRRIESLLRPGVTSAIKAAGARNTEQSRAAKAAKDAKRNGSKGDAADTDEGEGGKKRKRVIAGEEGDYLEPEDRPVKTFAPKPAPRRLNDIAQAPPSLPSLKQAGQAGKAGKGATAFSTVGRDPLNAGQKRLLEEERERVVKRYREMKEEREKAKGQVPAAR